ncbi:hypothetical protein HZB74_00840 [Candidatus Saccharibacteria bacterium]|nr:hypothetical protein [Candidatus Saccharibacteria bacterium]
MDRQGFEKIRQVMEEASIGQVDIEPELQEGDDVRFVTIRPRKYVRPAIVLNALDKAGLLDDDGPNVGISGDPILEPFGIDAFGITFEDKNRR